MEYKEWIEFAEKVLKQYQEGAIFANEAFNAIVGKAYEVDQKDICSACGQPTEECKCDLVDDLISGRLEMP